LGSGFIPAQPFVPAHGAIDLPEGPILCRLWSIALADAFANGLHALAIEAKAR
jgi:hypothetical protein